MADEPLPFRGIDNGTTAYRALNPESKEIRYLSIAPGTTDASLSCSLEYTPLQAIDRVQYEALSYTWGDINETVTLDIRYPVSERSRTTARYAVHTFKVTPNLHAALRALRLQHRPRNVWVDFVCINQVDPVEKTQQILIMGEIYNLASTVLVWLGESDLFTDIAVHLIGKFLELVRLRRCVRYDSASEELERTIRQLKTVEEEIASTGSEMEEADFFDLLSDNARVFYHFLPLAFMSDPNANEQLCKAMSLMDLQWGEMDFEERIDAVNWILLQAANELVSRSYFRRIWVVQEVFRATRDSMGNHKVLVHIGDKRIRWTEFCEFEDHFYDYRKHMVFSNRETVTPNDTTDLDFFRGTWHNMWYFASTGAYRRDNSDAHFARSIYALLAQTRAFQATVVTDKLFAMMILADDTCRVMNEEPLIKPNFKKSEDQVLKDFVQWHIMRTGRLDILSFVSPLGPGSRSNSSPSWIPDIFHPVDALPFTTLLPVSSVSESIRLAEDTGEPLLKYPSLFVSGVRVARLKSVVLREISCVVENRPNRLYIEDARVKGIHLFKYLLDAYWDPITERSDLWFLYKCIGMFGCLESTAEEWFIGFVTYLEFFKAPIRDQETWYDFQRHSPPQEDSMQGFVDRIIRFTQNRRIVVCEDGTLGVCPEPVRAGDTIAMLNNGKFPYVLRAQPNGTFHVLGPCLFYGGKWLNTGLASGHDISGERFELV